MNSNKEMAKLSVRVSFKIKDDGEDQTGGWEGGRAWGGGSNGARCGG